MSELTVIPSEHDHSTLNLAKALRPLRGRRLQKLIQESRTRWHFNENRHPGDIVEMARDRRYRVAEDGSFRRVL